MFDGYQWEISSPSLADAPLFPAFLLSEIADRKNRGRQPGVNLAINAGGKVSHPGRVPFLFSIGSSLKFKGLPHEVIEAVLFVVNDMMCDPPQIESEVRRAALDAFNSSPVNPSSGRAAGGLDDWVSMVRTARERRA